MGDDKDKKRREVMNRWVAGQQASAIAGARSQQSMNQYIEF